MGYVRPRGLALRNPVTVSTGPAPSSPGAFTHVSSGPAPSGQHVIIQGQQHWRPWWNNWWWNQWYPWWGWGGCPPGYTWNPWWNTCVPYWGGGYPPYWGGGYPPYYGGGYYGGGYGY